MISLKQNCLFPKLLLLIALTVPFLSVEATAQTIKDSSTLSHKIKTVEQINPTTVQLIFTDNNRLSFDFYGENIFRAFEDTSGAIIRPPESKPPAKILVDNPRRAVGPLKIIDNANRVSIASKGIAITVDKNSSLFTVTNKTTGKVVLETVAPIAFSQDNVTLLLKENPDEYYYGGGVQNGRFSHKGHSISIENQNSWTDGGVASPTPFYWSTNGYGVMWYTFKPGKYDFGSKKEGEVSLSHNTDYFDVFFMIGHGIKPLLQDFYQLTGNPVLLPKFAFYEGHLNAYNRDYWKKDSTGILFEDGKRYKESQKNNGGTKESLNGELGNYQFSARAVIDRYESHNMPLGWILPNDGYGAGYGQTSTLDSNIANLKSFGDYARKKGVEIGLWTQSDLHPKPGISALLQRDIVKEVRDAGVRVLKTDVAWVGAGYSFGLNGVADVGHIVPYYGSDARPFIISLDGWAGTQRYATVWSGDQTGGNWEYIRFHIPTFIGSGLSGQPNITSDMDGIFGGNNPVVNARGFEWKTFTPMQLNMDGWGANEKYPQALGEPTTSINRTYLKLKSELLPYTYSIAKQAVTGLPIIRAMFLEQPNKYTLGKSTEYQFMYGPSFLVAPIYQATEIDKEGNDIRNNIYLPKGQWVDYFTGAQYSGDQIINSFDAPIWKLPVFVKRGAIIPMNNPNNHVAGINKDMRTYEVYPFGASSFTQYNDDGVSQAYKTGKGATTIIDAKLDGDVASIQVHATGGDFKGFIKQKATRFKVNVTAAPSKVTGFIGGKNVRLAEVSSLDAFLKGTNVYYYNEAPNLNQFATSGSAFEKIPMIKNPQVWVNLATTDITKNAVSIRMKGYAYEPTDQLKTHVGSLATPVGLNVLDSNKTAYTLNLSWDRVKNADYYEIEYNHMLYSTINGSHFLFENLRPETQYDFKLRAVNKEGHSDWAVLNTETEKNPLEFAIPGIFARSTAKDQRSQGIGKMFNFDESDSWHTDYDEKATPFDIVMDLKTINQLDKFEYLPRASGRNGILTKGTVYYSLDKKNWTSVGEIKWKGNNATKTFNFAGHPSARYIKISVLEGVGDFGSGRELYVFKVPGTESYLPGDINHDHKIDRNDLTSYMNYTGLRKGDADFEGYISKGDNNKNGVIDAYDISTVAIQLDGGIQVHHKTDTVSGALEIATSKQQYKKGDIIEVVVIGKKLKNVNALSFALPYNPNKYEYKGIDTVHVKSMENLTNDRLHSDGQKVLYPTFVNVGHKDPLNGSSKLFIIKFRAKQDLTFHLKANGGVLVDKFLDYSTF